MLLVPMWYNLFISLHQSGCLHLFQSLWLDSEELESDLLLEELLLDSQRFLEGALIFLIILISWHKPSFLAMLKSILFCFLRYFRYFFHFFILLVLFHSLIPTSRRYSQSILDDPVGAHSSAVLGTMQHIFLIRHSYLLAKY